MFDLATAKARLSIADTSKDALITTALNASLGLAELYCNRKFMFAAEKATFTHPKGNVLQLPRFPIEMITTVNGDFNELGRHVIRSTGQIVFDRDLNHHHTIVVDYTGGYRTLPDDILMALWIVFDSVFAMLGGSGAMPVGADRIQSITIPDVGTIRYESSGAASSAGKGVSSGALPDAAAAILSFYRLEVC